MLEPALAQHPLRAAGGWLRSGDVALGAGKVVSGWKPRPQAQHPVCAWGGTLRQGHRALNDNPTRPPAGTHETQTVGHLSVTRSPPEGSIPSRRTAEGAQDTEPALGASLEQEVTSVSPKACFRSCDISQPKEVKAADSAAG